MQVNYHLRCNEFHPQLNYCLTFHLRLLLLSRQQIKNVKSISHNQVEPLSFVTWQNDSKNDWYEKSSLVLNANKTKNLIIDFMRLTLSNYLTWPFKTSSRFSQT